MDEALKTEKVIMTITSSTSDIGPFTEGQEIFLTPELAEAAIKAGIAERSKKEGKGKKKDNKAPQEAGDKHTEKEEVKDHGRE